MSTTAAVETIERPDVGAAAPGTVRVLVVCPVRLYRDGIANRLRREPGMTVVGGVAGPEAALACLAESGPAVVLLDAAVLGSVDLVRRLSETAPGTTVLALALAEEGRAVVKCAEAGIVGYVPPRASLDDLVGAVRGAVHGELRCPPHIAGSLFRRLTTLARERRDPPRRDAPRRAALTQREREVLDLLGEGHTNKAIARRLGIEVATVKNHVHRVLEKLDVKGRTAAAQARNTGRPEAVQSTNGSNTEACVSRK